MRRPITRRLHCSVAGCQEWSFREYDNRRDYLKGEARDREWKCQRHTGILLLPEFTSGEWISDPNGPSKAYPDIPRTTLFFGHSGLVFAGPMKAYAKDFPVGTRIRITMEAILPQSSPADAGAQC